MQKDNKPKVDKASLEASKKLHEKAINQNQIVKKDENLNTGKPKR
jgi:hypothetical protein